MNQFYRQLTRKALPTVLLALLLAVACAFCGIGFSAWDTAERQLAAADSQYTTIGVLNGKEESSGGNYRGLLFFDGDGPWTTLAKHKSRTYPGLLTEDCRGYLAAQVPGRSSLSSYEQWDFRSQCFEAYGNQMAVLAVRCTKIDYEMEKSFHELDPAGETHPGYWLDFSLEDVVCRRPEHDILPEELTIFFQAHLRTEEGKIPFEEGHTYLLFGFHQGLSVGNGMEENRNRKEGEPRWIMEDHGREWFYLNGASLPDSVPARILGEDYTGDATGWGLIFRWREVQGEEGPYLTLSSDSLPFYAEYEGDWREFLESEEGHVWQEEVIPLCQMNYETVNVILTDNANSMVEFNDGRASILEGRSISGEEYAAGSPVCLVSAAYAQKNGLAVGDTIDLDFYKEELSYCMDIPLDLPLAEIRYEPIWAGQPCVPEDRLGLEKEYTIVGTYTAPEFGYGWHSFNGNTVFVPKASIPNAEEYEEPQLPLLYSIILENGKAEEFEAYLESIGFGGLFEYYDQDYNAASAAFAAMAENARRLFLVGLGALALAGALFLFLSLRRLAPTARGMRLMGIPAKKVWRELWAALAVLVLASAALGALLGWWLYGAVTGRTLAAGMGLRPEALALCAAVQAAALAVLAALAAIPAARPRLLRAGGKKR